MDQDVKITVKIADKINAKRRAELFQMMDKQNPMFKYLDELRRNRVFKEGSRDKVYRKIASMPLEVDLFFSRIYGADYYKDKDFFTKSHPEWAVIGKLDI